MQKRNDRTHETFCIYFLLPTAPSTWSIKENTSYAFTFSEKLYNYDVRNAALHLHVRPRRRNQAPSVYYVILRRVLDPPDGSDSPKIKTVSKKKIQLHAVKGHWVVLNMTGVAQEWLEDPQEHNVVQLSLVDADGNNYDDLLDTNTDREYRKVGLHFSQQLNKI